TSLTSPTAINENDTYTLSGTFSDAGTLDTHTVVITWGNGEGSTTLSLAAGVTSFSASHQYLDDNPSGTSSDTYPISVTVTDDDTGSGSGSTSVTVLNALPRITGLSGPSSINENGVYTLNGTFHHDTTLGTHRVVINWGGGTPGQPSEGTTTITYGGLNPA